MKRITTFLIVFAALGIGFVIMAFTLPLLISKKKNAINEKERSSPNVIIILADDLGYGDVGFNGCKDIPTPNIDRIAENGVKFTNGYVTYCVCAPSRAGILTGRYQERFGFDRNPLFTPYDPNMGLPLSQETLATALKPAHYQSMAIGKWHLGVYKTLRPLKRGFNQFYGFLSGGHEYFPKLLTIDHLSECKSQFDGYKTKLLRNNKRVNEKEYLTDAFTREAVKFIEKNKNNHFFIYLAYNAPHTPLQATEKYLKRFTNIKNKKRRTYAAMVSAMDDGVGRVLNKLKELNLENKTIVFFLSDNGGPLKKNGSSNGILRGKKGDLFEGGIRVPFAMEWPSVIPKGIVYNKPVISLDIFATVIAQSKIPIKPRYPLDGVNLIPYLTGKDTSAPHKYLFWEKYDAKSYAVRSGNFKMLIRTDKKTGKRNHLLYNLHTDISETTNLAPNNRKKFDMLLDRFNNWNKNMKPPAFMGLRMNKRYNELHPDRFKTRTKTLTNPTVARYRMSTDKIF